MLIYFFSKFSATTGCVDDWEPSITPPPPKIPVSVTIGDDSSSDSSEGTDFFLLFNFTQVLKQTPQTFLPYKQKKRMMKRSRNRLHHRLKKRVLRPGKKISMKRVCMIFLTLITQIFCLII